MDTGASAPVAEGSPIDGPATTGHGSVADPTPPARSTRAVGTRRVFRPGSLVIFGLILLAALLFRGQIQGLLRPGGAQTWMTIFVAVNVQALPFLVFGVLVSGAIAAFVPATLLPRVMPRRPIVAVPLAGVCGVALPGCECGSVPIAGRLMGHGVRPSAALAFLLSAPAINPVVLVATAVAFHSDLRMMWARLAAGLTTAVIVGLVWDWLGRPEWLRPRTLDLHDEQGPRGRVFVTAMRADFAQAAGFLVIGAGSAATLNVVVPHSWMEHVGSSMLLSVLLMGVLAFVMALCSEADAFVAASLVTIPMIGKLVFLTVGPAVDVKLVAMQTGLFGRRFAARFAPLTFVVAVLVGAGFGLLFWGV